MSFPIRGVVDARDGPVLFYPRPDEPATDPNDPCAESCYVAGPMVGIPNIARSGHLRCDPIKHARETQRALAMHCLLGAGLPCLGWCSTSCGGHVVHHWAVLRFRGSGCRRMFPCGQASKAFAPLLSSSPPRRMGRKGSIVNAHWTLPVIAHPKFNSCRIPDPSFGSHVLRRHDTLPIPAFLFSSPKPAYSMIRRPHLGRPLVKNDLKCGSPRLAILSARPDTDAFS
jgi:hypothetical protein